MLIPRIQELVCEHYVFPEVGERIAAAVGAVSLDGAPEADVADTLTAALQSVNGDRHLRVRHYPDGVPPELEGEDSRRHWRAHVAREGAGVLAARRLDGNIGLLTLGPVLTPPEYAGAHLSSAVTLLHGVDALIIDLRRCIGGAPETVALAVSHFSGSEPVHLQDIVQRDGSVAQSWTFTGVVPKMPAATPAWVLTSRQTFSGGEELAYDLQALGRAQVVGEITGGGAHPRTGFDLTATLQLHLPTGRSVNTVTGTNWEGVGVLPDVACDADAALDRALSAASSRPPVNST